RVIFVVLELAVLLGRSAFLGGWLPFVDRLDVDRDRLHALAHAQHPGHPAGGLHDVLDPGVHVEAYRDAELRALEPRDVLRGGVEAVLGLPGWQHEDDVETIARDAPGDVVEREDRHRDLRLTAVAGLLAARGRDQQGDQEEDGPTHARTILFPRATALAR